MLHKKILRQFFTLAYPHFVNIRQYQLDESKQLSLDQHDDNLG